MMYGFGDTVNPRDDTLEMMEDLVMDYVYELARHLISIYPLHLINHSTDSCSAWLPPASHPSNRVYASKTFYSFCVKMNRNWRVQRNSCSDSTTCNVPGKLSTPTTNLPDGINISLVENIFLSVKNISLAENIFLFDLC